MSIILICIAVGTSTVGAICGMGGGIILKPVLQMAQIIPPNMVNTLSVIMVFSLAAYSIIKSFCMKELDISLRKTPALAFGAIVGGLIGEKLLSIVFVSNVQLGEFLQALFLAIITMGILVYMQYKEKIDTKDIKSVLVAVFIGFFLGLLSSFLGIGGGPINLIVLHYFFSMSTKVATKNSLFIIFFAQGTTLLSYTLNDSPLQGINPMWIVGMIVGGIVGGILGRKINNRLSNQKVDKLLVIMMSLIIGISLVNIVSIT